MSCETQAVTPHIVVKDAAAAIEFYKKAFGATEIMRMAAKDVDCMGPAPKDDKRLVHAQIEINGSNIMLADEFPERECYGPQQTGSTAVSLHLYVDDVDAVMDRAALHGAKITMPAQDMFWGDRYGRLVDPFGHSWSVATPLKTDAHQHSHKEHVHGAGCSH